MAIRNTFLTDGGGSSKRNSKIVVTQAKKIINNNTSPTINTNKNTTTAPKVDISGLIADKRKYQELKANIELLIQYLDKSISNLEIPSEKIKGVYSIDSIGFDNEKINLIRKELIQRKEYLKYTVLVELDKNINKISEGIG